MDDDVDTVDGVASIKATLEKDIRTLRDRLNVKENAHKTRSEMVIRLHDRDKVAKDEIRKRKIEIERLEEILRNTEERLALPVSSCCGTAPPRERRRNEIKRDVRTKNEHTIEDYSIKDALSDVVADLKTLKSQLSDRGPRSSRSKDDLLETGRFDLDHVKVLYVPMIDSDRGDGVDVLKDRYDESTALSGTFRISTEYTFEMLLEDACLLFGVPRNLHQGATLRDEHHKRWPRKANVRLTMSRAMRERHVAAAKSGGRVRLPGLWLELAHDDEGTESEEKDDEDGVGLWDKEEYQKPKNERKRRAHDRDKLFKKIAILKTPVFHDNAKMGEEIMEAYGFTYEHPQLKKADEDNLKLEIHSLMQADLCLLLFHILFIVTIVYPLMYGRGMIFEMNDSFHSFDERIQRSFSTTASVEGSSANRVNASALQTPTHVIQFFKTPVLSAIFQCGEEVQGGECSTSSASTYESYELISNLTMHEYRTAATLGRRADDVECDGASESRPYLYWLMDAGSTSRTAIESSSIRCYNAYDPSYDDTASFGSFNYTEDFLGVSYETDRAVYLTEAFTQDLGMNYETAFATVTSLETSNWIDRSTRAVSVMGVLYSRNYQMCALIRVMVEIPPSGAMIVTRNINFLRLTDYNFGHEDTDRFYLLVLSDIYVALYTLSMLYVVIGKFRVYGFSRVLRLVWNCIDLIIIVLITVDMCGRRDQSYFQSMYEDLKVGNIDTAVAISRQQRRSVIMLAVTISLALVRAIKYFERNRIVEIVWRILSMIGVHLSALGLFIAGIMVATSLMCHIAVGRAFTELSTIQGTLLSLVGEIMGSHVDAFSGETLWQKIAERHIFFGLFARVLVYFVRYMLLYVVISLGLASYIQIRLSYHKTKEKEENREKNREWKPERISTGEFFRNFFLGFFFAKRKRETPSGV